ncbi:hypothetical protein ACFLQL_00760 [Verrucomicrobiota bacterium]
MIIPVITLWQPWAFWIMQGWKYIETRRHANFASLEEKMIGIHAGQTWDDEAIEVASKYLTSKQIASTNKDTIERGVLLGTVDVAHHRRLNRLDSKEALIDCQNQDRYGLILFNVQLLNKSIPLRGKQGIWNYDLKEK